MIKLRMFSYNYFAYTIMSDILYKKSQDKNPLIINLKGNCKSLLISFEDARRAVFGVLTCWLTYHVVLSCRGIGQFNCNNSSQQHVETIYGSFDFVSPTHTS